MNKPELLSPAGSFDALKAAVSGGADAVYLGASAFGARAGAQNFDQNALCEAIDYCHERNVLAYLTLNTLIADKEMKEALKVAHHAYCAGIDAFIVQDVGLFSLLSRHFPTAALHVSTQACVHNVSGARFFYEQGAKRIVLARECSFSDIKAIRAQLPVELEVFVHGALCIAKSGQCLMSSFLGGDSGNRGRCRQPCRKKYNGRYLLSPLDLCLLSHIRELADAGVTSFKIEGRMKGAQYVGLVTSIYRAVLDGKAPTPEDIALLQGIFSRGDALTEGYFSQKSRLTVLTGNASGENVYQRQKKEAAEAADRVIKTEKKTEISLLFTCDSDKAVLEAVSGRDSASASVPLDPRVLPLTEARLREQLLKWGNTPFVPERLLMSVGAPCTLSVASVNALRRSTLQALLEKKHTKKEAVPEPILLPSFLVRQNKPPFALRCAVRTQAQAAALLSAGAEVYTPWVQEGTVYLAPPWAPVEREQEIRDRIRSADCIIAGNPYAVFLARDLHIPYIAGPRLNVFNAYGAAQFGDALRITASWELTFKQIESLCRYFPMEALLYGRTPLMLPGTCPIKTYKGCAHCREGMTLKDETGAVFPVLGDECRHTGPVLYNSRPLFLADKKDAWLSLGLAGGLLSFTTETPKECVAIYQMYTGTRPITMPPTFSRGHAFSAVH